MNQSIYSQASDPKQYDNDDIVWAEKRGKNSPNRLFHYDYISKYKELWKDASILDIGSGTGWFLAKVLEEGAGKVRGIEPSTKNVQRSKAHHPEVDVLETDLFSYQTDEKYDLITSIVVLVHIADLDAAFEKCASLLKKKGELHIIVPDYDYFRRDRHNYEITIEDIDEDEYVVMTSRSIGKLADIVRRKSKYLESAEKAGFELIESVAMKPTEGLIQYKPSYQDMKDVTITHLLRFRKVS